MSFPAHRDEVVAVRVSLRRPDGDVVARERVCWRVSAPAAEVLRELAGRALAARREGLRLTVDDAPRDVLTLLRAVGLS